MVLLWEKIQHSSIKRKAHNFKVALTISPDLRCHTWAKKKKKPPAYPLISCHFHVGIFSRTRIFKNFTRAGPDTSPNYFGEPFPSPTPPLFCLLFQEALHLAQIVTLIIQSNECLLNHQHRNNQKTFRCLWLIAEANGIPGKKQNSPEQLQWCKPCCNVEESEKPNYPNNCGPTKVAPFLPWMVQESHQTSMQLMNSTFLLDLKRVSLFYKTQRYQVFLLQRSADNI